jgi:hypothetical protein
MTCRCDDGLDDDEAVHPLCTHARNPERNGVNPTYLQEEGTSRHLKSIRVTSWIAFGGPVARRAQPRDADAVGGGNYADWSRSRHGVRPAHRVAIDRGHH